jgi:hypothetical protein
MYCIPDIDYFKDYNMIFNDNIIDCFLNESHTKDTKPEELEKMVVELTVKENKTKSGKKRKY